jgi:hypothetical protein
MLRIVGPSKKVPDVKLNLYLTICELEYNWKKLIGPVGATKGDIAQSRKFCGGIGGFGKYNGVGWLFCTSYINKLVPVEALLFVPKITTQPCIGGIGVNVGVGVGGGQA